MPWPTARITMPTSWVRLSAGRQAMSDELQTLCFLAGANSMFYGDRLLTTSNPQAEKDRNLLDRLGMRCATEADLADTSNSHGNQRKRHRTMPQLGAVSTSGKLPRSGTARADFPLRDPRMKRSLQPDGHGKKPVGHLGQHLSRLLTGDFTAQKDRPGRRHLVEHHAILAIHHDAQQLPRFAEDQVPP